MPPSARPHFSPGQRIGLFGGSFNPPHEGHYAVALEALKSADLDWVWWMVSPQNPLKDPKFTEDFAERLAATSSLATHPRFRVTDIEKRIGSRITAETLEALKPLFKQARFVWIMGADSLAGLHRWRRWKELPLTLPLLVVDRPGWTFRALSSPAAAFLGCSRLKESDTRLLPSLQPPAWAFLTLPLRQESSTAIRTSSVVMKSHRKP
ncbi:MAG TPA: nicotinate-nucleotide adenylyltransferase [Aestuariivirgaceae bacterium]|jgi:nicotinate-nucleotide adenylyltransferase